MKTKTTTTKLSPQQRAWQTRRKNERAAKRSRKVAA